MYVYMSDTSLNSIINKINNKAGKMLFDISNISGMSKLLKSFHNIEYVGHGVQSICFKDISGNVIKCCVKRKSSIISTRKILVDTTNKLLDLHMPILPIISVLYEDNNWMVYNQPMCKIIERVDMKFCLCVIRFVQQMIKTNIRFSDIYYKNFGVYQNKILLFDYHDIEDFSGSSNFLITNLYSLFTLLGQSIGWRVVSTSINHWDEITNDNFGKSRFPMPLYELLVSLHNRDMSQINTALEGVNRYFVENIKSKVLSYHSLVVNSEGIINIEYPYDTYLFIFNYVKKCGVNTIVDLYPTDCGLGLKLAQDFPNVTVSLGCCDGVEIADTKYIISNSLIYNTKIIDNKPIGKYDLTIFTVHSDRLPNLQRIIKTQLSTHFLIEMTPEKSHMICETPTLFRTYLCECGTKVNRCFLTGSGTFLFICELPIVSVRK